MSRPLKPCGTVAAYHRHLRHDEAACGPCRAAIKKYSAARRAEGGTYLDPRTGAVQVPKMLFAEVYLNSPLELQDRIEKELGRRKLDALVRLFDSE